MWSNNYIGIPFKAKGRTTEGIDCWGLARLIYKNEYGISLPSFSEDYEGTDTERMEDLIAQYKEGWESISEPEEGSIVLFRLMGTESHVGVAVSSTQFIHAREGHDSAIESFASTAWNKRIVGHFKYNKNSAVLNAVPHPLRTERFTVPIPSGTKLDTLAAWILKEYNIASELKSKITIILNGKVVPECNWSDITLQDTDTIEYRAVPTGGSTTRLVLTLAVIYAAAQFGAYLSAPEVAATQGGATGAGWSAGSAAAATAVASMAGMALVNYIAPIRPPDMGPDPKDAGTAERALMVSGAQNRPNPYGAIPVVLGKVRIAPPLGAINYLTYENERDNYLTMLLTWGYGPLTIYNNSFRIGEQDITNYTDYTLITLDRKTTETSDALSKFNAVYGKDITQSNPNLELVCDGNPETTVPAGPWAETISTEVVDSVTIALHFPQGLRKIKAKGEGAGDSFNAPTVFEIQYLSNNTWYSLENALILGNDAPKKDAFTFTKTYSISDGALPINNGLTIRVRRDTGDNVEDNPDYRYYHQSILKSVTFTRNATPAIDPNGAKIAKTAFKIKATDQLNGSIEGVNALVQTYCKSWNGTEWLDASTNNPADLFRYVLEHPANSQKITNPSEKFDLVQLQHWATYCNTHGFQYNSVLGTQRSILEVLRDICAAGRASPALVDGKWSVTIDEVKPNIVQHFTPHNSWEFEASKALPKIPDGLRVTYFDEDSNYQESEIIVYSIGKNESNSELFESIQLPGVTKKSSVIDHARWHMAQARLRPEVYTLNSDIEYLVCNRGDRVKVTHDIPMWGLGSGRIKDRVASNILELDEPQIYQTGKNYTIRVRSAIGESTVRNTVTSVATTKFERLNGIATVTLDNSGHAFSVGELVLITMPSVGILTVALTAITDNTLSFNNFGPDQTITSNGTAKCTDGYYQKVKLTSDISESNASPLDLFLYGELNTEAQDLIVLSVEPTNNKAARLTLVDYGVTPTYNIFTDYLTLTEDNVFESQITLPPKLLIDSFNSQVPIATKYISDESVMERIGPGIFKYNLKVSYTNSPKLPKTTQYVQAQYDYASSTDSLNTKIVSNDFMSGSISISDVVEGEEYKVRLRYISTDGRISKWSAWQNTTIVGKSNPPQIVTGFTIVPDASTGKLNLSWNNNSEIDIKAYEVRTADSNWGTSQDRVFYGATTSCLAVPEDSAHTRRFYIRAVDYSNNYSTISAYQDFISPIPNAATNLTYRYGTSSSNTNSTVTFNWSDPSGSFFSISGYEITVSRPDVADEVLNISGNSYTTSADWLGNATLSVVAIDIANSRSLPAVLTVPKYAPSPAVAFSTEVVDNNVLLRWTYPEATSLPISHVMIKRGTTWNEADKVIGQKNGTFTSVFELAGGRYTYWLAVVDTDNRESSPVPVSVTVSQPPDFVFNAEYTSGFSGTKYSTANITNSTSLLMLVDTVETWAEHFSSNSWASPQAQINAGYPYYAQPSSNTAYYEEIFDYGQVLASSSITVSHIGNNLVGSPINYIEISTSLDNITWTDVQKVDAIFATNFRYIKVRVTAVASVATDLYELKKLVVRLDNKQVSDSGSINAVSTDALGTIINFNKEIIDVQSVTLTPAGTTPLSAVYDLYDNTLAATYSITSGVCTVNAVGHSLETGQNVRLAFTSGSALNGVYMITKINANQYTVSMVGQSNTSGNVITYPQSMRVYVFNSTNGSRQSAKVSWQIKGY